MHMRSFAIGVGLGVLGTLLAMAVAKLILPLLIIVALVVGGWLIFGGGNKSDTPARR